MGIFDFVKDAGERLFGGGAKAEAADKAKAKALTDLVGKMDLGVEKLDVQFADGVATIAGAAPSQAVREKIVLLVGNTQGVGKVDDRMTVERPEPPARMHTVASGDTLSKIAKQYYGDAMKYPTIFEANRPMLKDPNRIYPGQVLRIPPLD